MTARLPFVPVLAVVLAVVACDTGDGTQLRPPAPGQTAPPPSTTTTTVDPAATLPTVPVTSVPITSVPIDSGVPASLDPVTLPVPDDSAVEALTVFGPWVADESVPERYTCVGEDLSPPVSWLGLPGGTVEIAVSLVDESVPRDDGRGFVHWVVAAVDPARRSLVEGQVPPGAVQALNSFGDIGYGGPCPPPGEVHEYRLTVHALRNPTGLADGTPASELLDAIEGATVESASVVGTFRGAG